MPSDAILPIILCGGSGSRLWPLSRKSFPKQFLNFNFTENKSLLQRTQNRTKLIKNIKDPILICNEEHRFIVAEQMREIEIKPLSIILEPFGRNTAPAIAIAALKALEFYSDPNLLVLSSDHQINDEKKFSKAVLSGLDFSMQGKLVNFGIFPTSPETGFGYIKSQEKLNKDDLNCSKIDCFIEKPDFQTATQFLKDSRFTWNSGIFLFKASTILNELEEYLPELIKYSQKSLGEKLYDLDFQRLDENYFSKCPDISIDCAVMEKTHNAYVLPLDAGWSDVGSWDSIWNISKKDAKGNVVEGNIHIENTKNCYLNSGNRLVAAVGLENLIVVDTSDAILVMKKDQSQALKNIVANLKSREVPQVFEHKKGFRPWGDYESLAKERQWQVKLIKVKSGESLSLQKHQYRSEHWIVVSGIAKVEIDGHEKFLKENQNAYIPAGAKHRLSNPGKNDLKIIEVQSGSYLGEDDIERFEDNYGRIN